MSSQQWGHGCLSLRYIGCLLLSFRNPAVSTWCLTVLLRGGGRTKGVPDHQRCSAEVSELSVVGNPNRWIQRLTWAPLHSETQASLEVFIQWNSQDFPAGTTTFSPQWSVCRADWKLLSKFSGEILNYLDVNSWLRNSTGLLVFWRCWNSAPIARLLSGSRSKTFWNVRLWWISCKQVAICTEFMLLCEYSI